MIDISRKRRILLVGWSIVWDNNSDRRLFPHPVICLSRFHRFNSLNWVLLPFLDSTVVVLRRREIREGGDAALIE